MAGQPTVLIIDNDPSHLKLYSLIVSRGGFRALPTLARHGSVDLPRDQMIDVAVLDYGLSAPVSAVELAQRINQEFPGAPIIVLSDSPWMPDDISPFADSFVRSGEPQQLLDAIQECLRAASS